jgi:hypothetical protein
LSGGPAEGPVGIFYYNVELNLNASNGIFKN